MSNKVNSLGSLLEKNQTKIFFDYFANQKPLYGGLFGGQVSPIPLDIMCKACRGRGEVGSNVTRPCGVCIGKKIPPIPNYEIYGPENHSKAKND